MGPCSINSETDPRRAAHDVGAILFAKLVECGTVSPKERFFDPFVSATLALLPCVLSGDSLARSDTPS